MQTPHTHTCTHTHTERTESAMIQLINLFLKCIDIPDFNMSEHIYIICTAMLIPVFSLLLITADSAKLMSWKLANKNQCRVRYKSIQIRDALGRRREKTPAQSN